jgi:hypothetical protein
LATLLTDGGRVLFVDEPVDVRAKEAYVPGEDEVVERELADGSRFHIVKNFLDPATLPDRLAVLGWSCRVWRDGDDWICGEAQPANP